jgi:hypothetical protein
MTSLRLVSCSQGSAAEMIVCEAGIHGEFNVIISIVGEYKYRTIGEETYGGSIDCRNHLDWRVEQRCGNSTRDSLRLKRS